MERSDFLGVVALLAPREREVMEMVAAGLANRVIAGKLGIAIKTVENTIGRANKRFDVQLSRGEFMRHWWMHCDG